MHYEGASGQRRPPKSGCVVLADAHALCPRLPAPGSRWARSGRNGLPFPNGKVPGYVPVSFN